MGLPKIVTILVLLIENLPLSENHLILVLKVFVAYLGYSIKNDPKWDHHLHLIIS